MESGLTDTPKPDLTGGPQRPPIRARLLSVHHYRTMSYAQITATELSASEARSAVCDLADQFSWETVAREMLSRMSGDEAREFLEDFRSLYDA